MSRAEAVNKVINVRGLEDYYALLISRAAEEPATTDAEIIQLMFDILLGIEK